MAELEEAKDAILEAITLHAIAQGKKTALAGLSSDITAKIGEAEEEANAAAAEAETVRAAAVNKALTRRDKVRATQDARMEKAQAEADAAWATLVRCQEKIFKDTGAVIDLTAAAAASGGQTAL